MPGVYCYVICTTPILGGVSLSPAALPSVAHVLHRGHRIEFDMVQQPSSPLDLPTEFDHHVVLFPTRREPYVPTELS